MPEKKYCALSAVLYVREIPELEVGNCLQADSGGWVGREGVRTPQSCCITVAVWCKTLELLNQLCLLTRHSGCWGRSKEMKGVCF